MFERQRNPAWKSVLAVLCLCGATVLLAEEARGLIARADRPEKKRTEEQTRDLEEGLAILLREGISRDLIERHLGKLKSESGAQIVKGPDWDLRVTPPGKKEAVQRAVFETRDPIAGEALLETLGMQQPGVISTGSNPENLQVVDFSSEAPPMAHGYEIRIYLQRGDYLRPVDRMWGASTSAWRASRYPVRRIEIERP